jgi:hypothetical protein
MYSFQGRFLVVVRCNCAMHSFIIIMNLFVIRIIKVSELVIILIFYVVILYIQHKLNCSVFVILIYLLNKKVTDLN